MNESVERVGAQRFQRWSRRVLGGLLLLSLALGFIGYQQYFKLSWPLYWVDGFNLFYLDLQLFGFEFTTRPGIPVPWPLEIARVIAPITTFFAVVAAASLVFREQVGWFLARTLRLELRHRDRRERRGARHCAGQATTNHRPRDRRR